MRSAISAAAAPSSQSRAASTRASSPGSACARSGPSRSMLPATARARCRRQPRPTSASSWRNPSAPTASRSRSPRRSKALGCYEQRDEAIRAVFADYEPDWQHKLVRSAPIGGDDRLLAGRRAPRRHPGAAADAVGRVPGAARGDEHEAAGPQASSSTPGRTGSPTRSSARPNLLEYDQGFFVKGGDGLADVKPIAGLYKSQVYALARELGLPECDHRRGRRRPRPSRCRRPRRSSTSATPTSAWTCWCGASTTASSRPSSARGSG